MKKRYALALDLVDDPESIAEYEAIHRAVVPEILASIREVGRGKGGDQTLCPYFFTFEALSTFKR